MFCSSFGPFFYLLAPCICANCKGISPSINRNFETSASLRTPDPTIQPNDQATDGAKLRVEWARRSSSLLHKILYSFTDISLHTKLHIYQAAVLPVLTYEIKAWPLRVEDTKLQKCFNHRHLRYMAEIKKYDHVSRGRASVLYECQFFSSFLQNRCLQRFRHILYRR